MTNTEINLNVAVKALEQNLLNSFEKQFVESIKHYTKKDLRGLSSKQYNVLNSICNKYFDQLDN